MRRWLPVLLLALASGADLPKIPPLPATSWPSPEAADPFARELLATVPPDELARTLAANPELVPRILRNLGTALMSSDPALHDAVGAYISRVAQVSAARPKKDVRQIVSIVVVDPLRYAEESAFRARINGLLPHTLASMPPSVARAILNELTQSAPIDFDAAESAAAAAHIVPRSSNERRVPFESVKLEMPDDLSGPIDASIFSLSSPYFTPGEVKLFLTSLLAASPRRRIIVLGDDLMRKALEHVDFIDNGSRSFTPWPRDPFIVARSAGGEVVFINRPNVQQGREEDQNMARAIVQQLPPALDSEWKNLRWTVAPIPFHNGHMLLTPSTVWISIHTVEPRALALLGLDRVPVETFKDRSGVNRYVEAVRQAAGELQKFFGRPVRFVHPLPSPQESDATDLMNRLGGGAGFDLDSIVTILSRSNGESDALVGDLGLGVTTLRQSSTAELSVVRQAYGFRDPPDVVRKKIIDVQSAPQTVALQRFLDDVAEELRRDGMTVRRLPLLNVPTALLTGNAPPDFDFLITWNNVVLEKRGNLRRAEGFASRLASADRYAKKTFAASGYQLDLFPPLIASIVRGGGYRCASNHLRPPTPVRTVRK